MDTPDLKAPTKSISACDPSPCLFPSWRHLSPPLFPAVSRLVPGAAILAHSFSEKLEAAQPAAGPVAADGTDRAALPAADPGSRAWAMVDLSGAGAAVDLSVRSIPAAARSPDSPAQSADCSPA